MKTIAKIMVMAGMAAAMSESNYMLNEKKHTCVNNNPEPGWKRKKCKTCRNCGSFCNPNNKYRITRPQHSACEKYSKRSK